MVGDFAIINMETAYNKAPSATHIFRPSLSESGPANGRIINRPNPAAATTVATNPISLTMSPPHCVTSASFIICCPNTPVAIP